MGKTRLTKERQDNSNYPPRILLTVKLILLRSLLFNSHFPIRTMKRTLESFFQKKVQASVPSPAPAPAPSAPSPFTFQRHRHGWSENRLPWALTGIRDPPSEEPPPKKAKKVPPTCTHTSFLLRLSFPSSFCFANPPLPPPLPPTPPLPG